MGTRSLIAVEQQDKGFKSIYVHYDGYPKHVGRVLTGYYPNKEDADKLLKVGDIVGFEADGSYEAFNSRPREKTRAIKSKNYLRLKDLGEQMMVEYIYVYNLDGSIDCHTMT